MPTTPLRRLLLPLLLLIAPLPAQTQEEGRLYAVELIVFSRDGGGFEEIWPDQLALRYPDRTRRLALRDNASAEAASSTQTPLWTSLPASELQLRNTAAAIDRQAGMRVLVHERWVQPAHWQGQPGPVAITGGRAVGDPSATDRHFELEGYVTLRASRFLHFQTHLWLSEFTGDATPVAFDATPPFRLPELPPRHGEQETAADPINPADSWEGSNVDSLSVATAPSPSQVMALQQQRRIRFGEQHYFDHPRFGVLVQVTEYHPEEITAPEGITPPSDNPPAAQ